MKKNNIIPQMFDIKPVDENGDFDVEKFAPFKNKAKSSKKISSFPPKIVYDIAKSSPANQEIERFQKILAQEKKESKKEKERYRRFEVPVEADDIQNVDKVSIEYVERKEDLRSIGEPAFVPEHFLEKSDYFEKFKSPKEKKRDRSKKIKKQKEEGFSFRDVFFYEKNFRPFSSPKLSLSFIGAAMSVFILVFGFNLVTRGLGIKKAALESQDKVYADLISAKDNLSGKNFVSASLSFDEAQEDLDQISKNIDSLGGIIVESSKYVPYLSKLSSASHMAKVGRDLSEIGSLVSKNIEILEQIKNPSEEKAESISYLKIFKDSSESLFQIAVLLKDVEENLKSVNVSDIPEDKRSQFIELKKGLPEASKLLSNLIANEEIFSDILGGNGPRKYLFLFQNNQEMRATGGFIGTYAVLDIFNGRVRNFFVDGIFNPDGQLKEKIVPPAPIQKISANWSLHDSNWFPDFPRSAEKATLFYEKTGGPTVDGVIAITPIVLAKLLEVTGPIEMNDYGVTIDKDNFLEAIQNEVEYDYNREENQPKKIISDLAPIILDKIFNAENISDIAKTMNILTDSLNEKHILIYAKNWKTEKVLSDQGWSGEILDTQKDYLSVVNTNINGYKTDGVILEKISHSADIQADGSVIDTVSIVRKHNGGKTAYDFWNKVNADYMRVYVPKGSKLISASGQTREFNSPPLDYDALGYKRDPQVEMEEKSISTDDESGTRIYEDAQKTVFANWAYVSPGELVEIKYTYLLPFKIETNFTSKPADTYSLLAQKQAGSIGSEFSSKISYPNFYKVLWRYPDRLDQKNNYLETKTDLVTDKFFGIAISK